MTGSARGVNRRRDGLRQRDLDMSNVSDANTVQIAVDVMGGDADPTELIHGVALASKRSPHARYILHGDDSLISRALFDHAELASRAQTRHTEDVVPMDMKPAEAVRRADGSSMANALDSVRNNEAAAAVSSGNTGALMAMATLRLGRVENVDRPAIAVLWPTVSPDKRVIVLDVGADIRLEIKNLLQCACMGAQFARTTLRIARPRVGLLNIGAEQHKGLATLRDAAEQIERAAAVEDFEFHGYVEANDIPMDVVDVAVTDGFTGNIALKAAEGAAKLIGARARQSLSGAPMAWLGALLASRALRDMKHSLDPRSLNGGVFLGLQGAVVKSHGAVDALGFSAAIDLATRMGAASAQEPHVRTVGLPPAA